MDTNPWIFGMHDYHPDWVALVKAAGKSAWCVHTEAVGCDPNDRSGKAYPTDVTNIARLNNGYGKGTGVIPLPNRYDDFARRCANFVAASQNIWGVIIGNEIGLEWEQPDDNPIRLTDYVACYLKCYAAIKAVAPNVKISMQAPAPWNNRTPDAQDWVMQLATQLNMVGQRVDWIALHAYTKGYGADKFANNPRMGAPYQHRAFGWEVLYEQMGVIPYSCRHLPVLVTECNADEGWAGDNSGWLQSMYADLDKWNQSFGSQKILGACPFRWAKHDDKWDMSRHGNAVDDYRQALARDYRHGFVAGPAKSDMRITTADALNVRETPNGTIIGSFPKGTEVMVHTTDGEWLKVTSGAVHGWVHGAYVL